MADINNETELNAAVLSPGVYTVAPGTYATLTGNFAPGITLRAEDPNNKPIINKFWGGSNGGATFEDIHFKYKWTSGDASSTACINIVNMTDLTFTRCRFEGDFNLDEGYTWGFVLKCAGACDRMLIQNCYGTRAAKVLVPRGDDVQILNSEFNEVRADPISVDDVTNLIIRGNYIHNSQFRAPLDHGDAIQLLKTVGGTSVIEDNLISMIDGYFTQGIYGGGQAKTGLTIRNNVLFANHLQGITGGGYDDTCFVTGNKIIQIPPDQGRTGGETIPRINPGGTLTNANVTGNTAPVIQVNFNEPVPGNTIALLDQATEWAAAQSDPRWAHFFSATPSRKPFMMPGGKPLAVNGKFLYVG